MRRQILHFAAFLTSCFFLIGASRCCVGDPYEAAIGTKIIETEDPGGRILETGKEYNVTTCAIFNSKFKELSVIKDGTRIGHVFCAAGDCFYGAGLGELNSNCYINTNYNTESELWNEIHLKDGEAVEVNGDTVTCEESFEPEGKSEGDCLDSSYEGVYQIEATTLSGDRVSIKWEAWWKENHQDCNYLSGARMTDFSLLSSLME